MTTNPTDSINVPSNSIITARDANLAALADQLRELLLDQHLHPDYGDGNKLTRYEQGAREGRIVAYCEVLAALHPGYERMTAATLRIVLLGEALTAHAAGDTP